MKTNILTSKREYFFMPF